MSDEELRLSEPIDIVPMPESQIDEYVLETGKRPWGSMFRDVVYISPDLTTPSGRSNVREFTERHETGHLLMERSLLRRGDEDVLMAWKELSNSDYEYTLFGELVANLYSLGQVADEQTKGKISNLVRQAENEGLPSARAKQIVKLAKTVADRLLREQGHAGLQGVLRRFELGR